LSDTRPLSISITWGAGGTTKERSLDLAGLSQKQFGVDTVLHLTCTNIEQGGVDEALKVANRMHEIKYVSRLMVKQNAKARGIQNILALRGGQS
jgi:methylenetetrahydrofolate reductase (NADPH)